MEGCSLPGLGWSTLISWLGEIFPYYKATVGDESYLLSELWNEMWKNIEKSSVCVQWLFQVLCFRYFSIHSSICPSQITTICWWKHGSICGASFAFFLLILSSPFSRRWGIIKSLIQQNKGILPHARHLSNYYVRRYNEKKKENQCIFEYVLIWFQGTCILGANLAVSWDGALWRLL